MSGNLGSSCLCQKPQCLFCAGVLTPSSPEPQAYTGEPLAKSRCPPFALPHCWESKAAKQPKQPTAAKMHYINIM